MKKFFIVITLLSFFFQVPTSSNEPFYFIKEGQLIRRAYLDVWGVPPSLHELNWYLTYNQNSYETAVNDLLKKDSSSPRVKDLAKNFLLSIEYKTRPLKPLTMEEMSFIVRYQGGDLSSSLLEADKRLVRNSILNKENGIDPIDYLAELLMARSTSASEETFLTKIIKKYPSDEEGYLAALQVMKTFKDFTHK